MMSGVRNKEVEPMIQAKIICDSINPCGNRIVTFQCKVPKFILAELNTHRMLSRNAASTRAIPLKRQIRKIRTDPVFPVFWGKNQRGMSAQEEVDDELSCKEDWTLAMNYSLEIAERLGERGLHKQTAGRIIEPYMYVDWLATSTDWEYFFTLRNSEKAQPEMRELARQMQAAYDLSRPKKLLDGEWHIPFGDSIDTSMINDTPLKVIVAIATARCARISYETHNGLRDPIDDLRLHDTLLTDGHMCYDESTEILTENGWRCFSALSSDDKVAAVDINTLSIVYEKPSAFHEYRFEGKMYHIQYQSLDLMVTPNHNMVVSTRNNSNRWSDFMFRPASDIGNKPVRYLKAGSLVDRVHPTNPFSSLPSFYKLVGFFIGDGHSGSKNTISFHVRKKRKIQYLKDICENLGFDLKELSEDRWRIYHPNIGEWFRQNCYTPDKKKKLPDKWVNATMTTITDVMDGLKNSDGSIKRKTWLYCTCSDVLRDQLQHLAAINGFVFTCSEIKTISSNHNKCYTLNFSKRIFPRVELTQKGRGFTARLSYPHYSGMVYCVTTSTGAVIVRRNKKVAVSGNSPFEHVAHALNVPERVGNFKGWVQYRKIIELPISFEEYLEELYA